MTRTELERKINEVKAEIWYEEMADLHYNFAKVKKLENELKTLNEELAKLG